MIAPNDGTQFVLPYTENPVAILREFEVWFVRNNIDSADISSCNSGNVNNNCRSS